MIPFMRGYANITGESNIYKDLCKVMHGYESDYVDIGGIYNELFKDNIEALSISTKEIMGLECMEILDTTVYPLLNKSLYHTLFNTKKIKTFFWNRTYGFTRSGFICCYGRCILSL